MDASITLSVPKQHYGITDVDEPIFISTDEHPFMTLSNSPSLNNEDTEPHEQTSLLRTVSIDMPIRVSTLLDDIQDEEVTKLKFELQQAKDELNEINESAETKIKKVKAEGEFLGLLKEQKQRSSMKHLQMNYESELHQINRKLMITQNLHVAEIKKMKKSHVKHSLEIKLKDQKIKQLSTENSILIAQKNDIKKLMQSDSEKLRNEFNEQMEKEINKRITQISQLKKETQAKLTAKDNENKQLVNELAMDEKDKLINSLKNKIKQLEIDAEKEENMFFKHSEIMDYKLERETKDRKRLEKQLMEQKIEFETDLETIKKQLIEQNEINIHLQNNLEIIIEENNELNKVKQYVEIKENENNELRVSVNSHSQKLKELQNMLNAEKADNGTSEYEISYMKQSNIEDNNIKHKYQTSYMSFGADHEIKLKHVGELETIKMQYNKLINDMNSKHEQLQVKYMDTKNKLMNVESKNEQLINECTNMKNKLGNASKLLKHIETTKVELATNFAQEMDRIRGIIKKQNYRNSRSLLIVPVSVSERA